MSDSVHGASAVTVLEEAIAALARADAQLLERLTMEAGEAVVPGDEQGAARERYAALGLLLRLTQRNLRLLRGERGAMYGKG